ncbi:MAG: hypothetical protein ACR2MW_08670 [Chthoniobacterales bacterium]
MKRLTFDARALTPTEKTAVPPETEALKRNLDRIYNGLRRRAQREWLRGHAGADPSDACVSVRIHGGTELALSGSAC